MAIYQLRASDNYPYFESLSNLCAGWLIPGQLNVPKFKAALEKLVEKRPYLAGQMRRGKHGLYIKVDNKDFGFVVEKRNCKMGDLIQYDRPDRITTFKLDKKELSNLLIPGSRAMSFHGFLVSNDPIFQVHVIQCTDGFKLGMLICHHIADGVGWGNVLKEITAALDGKDLGPPVEETGHIDPFTVDPLVKDLGFTPGKHNVKQSLWSASPTGSDFNAFLLGSKVAYDVYWHQRQLVEMYIPISKLRAWQAAARAVYKDTIISRHDVITAYLWKIRASEAAATTPCLVFWVADYRGFKEINCPKDTVCNCVIENLTPAILAKDVLAMPMPDLALIVRNTTLRYRKPEVVKQMLNTMLESGRSQRIYMHTPSPLSECLFLTNWTKAGLCELDLSACVEGGGKSVRCLNNLSATVPMIINVDPDESARIKMSVRPKTLQMILDNPEYLLEL